MNMLKQIIAALLIIAFAAMGVFADESWNYTQSRYYSPNPDKVTSVSTTYSILTTDQMVKGDASSAAFTMTLPPIKSNGLGGKVYIINKVDTSLNLITIAASTTDSVANTIEGKTTRVITVPSGYVKLMAVGYDWKVQWESAPFKVDMTTGEFSPYRGTSGLRLTSTPTASATTTYLQSDCGKVISVSTGTNTIALPTAAPGCEFTIINTGANGANIVDIKAASTDAFYGPIYSSATATGAASTVTLVTSSTGSTLSNTKATALKGDACRIVSPLATIWNILCTGIWTTK